MFKTITRLSFLVLVLGVFSPLPARAEALVQKKSITSAKKSNEVPPAAPGGLKLDLSAQFTGAASVGIWASRDDQAQPANTFFSIPSAEVQISSKKAIKNPSLPASDVGVVMRINLKNLGINQGNIIFDLAYIYAQNEAGRVHFGSLDGPANALHNGATNFAVGSSIEGPAIVNVLYADNSEPLYTPIFINSTTYAQISSHAHKLTYYTPLLNGVRIGVGYTPDVSWGFAASQSGMPNPSAAYRPSDDTPDKVFKDILDSKNAFAAAKHVTEVSLSYMTQITKPLSLSADVFYVRAWDASFASHSNAPTDALVADVVKQAIPEEYGLGIALGYANPFPHVDHIKLTYSFLMQEDVDPITHYKAFKGSLIRTWSTSIAQDIGRWTMGVAYLESVAGYRDAPTFNTRNHHYGSLWQLGGSYKIEEGLRVGCELMRSQSSALGDVTQPQKEPLKRQDIKGYAINFYIKLNV